MSEKWQKVCIAAPLTVVFLSGVGGERQHDLGQPLGVVARDRDLFRDASRGDLEMPVARVNAWCVSDQVYTLEPEAESPDRPCAVDRAVRLERAGRLQN